MTPLPPPLNPSLTYKQTTYISRFKSNNNITIGDRNQIAMDPLPLTPSLTYKHLTYPDANPK